MSALLCENVHCSVKCLSSLAKSHAGCIGSEQQPHAAVMQESKLQTRRVGNRRRIIMSEGLLSTKEDAYASVTEPVGLGVSLRNQSCISRFLTKQRAVRGRSFAPAVDNPLPAEAMQPTLADLPLIAADRFVVFFLVLVD